MVKTHESDTYSGRYYARTKTATFEIMKKPKKTRGSKLPQFDTENELFWENVADVFRSPTREDRVSAEIASIGLLQREIWSPDDDGDTWVFYFFRVFLGFSRV